VLEFAGGIAFGVDVGNFLQLQRAFKRDRVVIAAAEEQPVFALAELLGDVANLMSARDVDRFPVVREGRLVGFLTRADLIRRLIAT